MLSIERDRTQDTPLRDRPQVTLADLNFDGCLDVRVPRLIAPSGNSIDDVWICDPASARYVFNATLSRAPRLEIDAERRELRGWSKAGGGEGDTIVYRWKGLAAILVRQESIRFNSQKACFEVVVKERRGGRMVETQRSCRE